MPYTPQSARSYFNDHPSEAKEPGDLTYVIYKPIYKMWKDKSRFKTFHELTRGQRNPRRMPQVVKDTMVALIKGGADQDDVFAAFDCAMLELWTRHVSKYEDAKFNEHGDVEV